MYTEVSEARNRLDEETDLALPWARSGVGGGSGAAAAFDVLLPKKGKRREICALCSLDCLEIPLYIAKQSFPLGK